MSMVPGQTINRNIPPMPPPMLAAMEVGKTYIFNVGPKSHFRPQGTSGTFIIPACAEGEAYSPALEYHGKPGLPSLVPETVVDAVEGSTVTYRWEFGTEGRKLALDIIGKSAFRDASDNLEQYGVFIAAGPVPTEAELEVANAKLLEHYGKLVRVADQAFEINGGMEMGDNGKSYPGINQDHVKAAKALGLDRPWSRVTKKMDACWNCGRAVLTTAAKCFHEGCGAPLKSEAAKLKFMGLDEDPEVEERRGPGRPRKDA